MSSNELQGIFLGYHINPALKKRRHSKLLHRQTYKTQLQNDCQSLKLIYYLPLRLLRPQFFETPTYSTSTPLKKRIYHLPVEPRARRATNVSIIATVRQNVGKTHKCQVLFSQSGYMSVALCGLSFGTVLQRLF